MQLTRREIFHAATGIGALGLASASAAAQASEKPTGDRPWFDISLAQWSNHRALMAGEIDNLGWITAVRKKYNISAAEFVSSFFKDKARDWKYLRQMRLRADDSGVQMLLIMVDGEGQLAAADGDERQRAVDNHRKWIVAASYLGCHSIRVNAGGSGTREDMQTRAAQSLVQLADYGAPYNVNVIVENHGGNSSDGKWLAGVMRTANHPGVGTLPDFGNFQTSPGVWYDRYKGIEELMPFAKAVSAKSHAFDADGNETGTDYMRMLRIVHAAGYRGHVGIEYEGSKHSESEGIRLTGQLLTRVRQAIG